MRALLIGIIAWLGFIVAGAVFGAFLSLGTGTRSELPKWNGWSYLVFVVKEGAMAGVELTWPIALLVFIVALVKRQSKGPV